MSCKQPNTHSGKGMRLETSIVCDRLIHCRIGHQENKSHKKENNILEDRHHDIVTSGNLRKPSGGSYFQRQASIPIRNNLYQLVRKHRTNKINSNSADTQLFERLYG